MRPYFRPAVLPVLVLLAGIPVAAQPGLAQSSNPNSAAVSRTIETTATVESVDPTTRQVLLHRQDGSYVTMVAPASVRNFAQIKPGDVVHARYEAALVARIGQPGHTLLSDQDLASEDTAARGQKPGAAYMLESRRKVNITAIDLAHNTVSFVGPANVERTLFVRTPQMRAFLKTLKVGDTIDVTYREAALIEVQAAR